MERATECVERGKWWSGESYRMCRGGSGGVERVTECVERGKWWSGESYRMCREGEVVECRELQNVCQCHFGQKTTPLMCDNRRQWICSHFFSLYSGINCAVQDLDT